MDEAQSYEHKLRSLSPYELAVVYYTAKLDHFASELRRTTSSTDDSMQDILDFMEYRMSLDVLEEVRTFRDSGEYEWLLEQVNDIGLAVVTSEWSNADLVSKWYVIKSDHLRDRIDEGWYSSETISGAVDVIKEADIKMEVLRSLEDEQVIDNRIQWLLTIEQRKL